MLHPAKYFSKIPTQVRKVSIIEIHILSHEIYFVLHSTRYYLEEVALSEIVINDFTPSTFRNITFYYG